MLNRYTAQKLYPGFESLPHRHFLIFSLTFRPFRLNLAAVANMLPLVGCLVLAACPALAFAQGSLQLSKPTLGDC